jgi:RNA polymerase-binding transcription factor DksA
MATTKMKKNMSTERYRDLKQMLEGRKREIQAQLQERIRDVRTENTSGKLSNVLDQVESSEAGIQEDIEFALIQMKAETLNKVGEALIRLEEGAYGPATSAGASLRRPLPRLRGGSRERPAARADDGAAPLLVGAVFRHEQLSFDPWRRDRTPRPRRPVPATPGRSPAIDGAPGNERRTRRPDVR